MPVFKKILAANRSEIATRIFRSAHEIKIRTVAIYSHEDRFALHRFKADEAYQIGKPGEPIRSYLDIDGIVRLCLENGIDAVHPGYGFLSENAEFARALQNAGITFIGPTVRALELLGDKVAARAIAQKVGVPVLEGSAHAVNSLEEAIETARQMSYPIMLKASKGGGGRGMRVVEQESELATILEQAQREAKNAFGSDEVFLEKLVGKARHLEVQILGDQHGNLIHLHERDCSVQRRHQKVVELAPAPNLDRKIVSQLHEAALAIGKDVGYHCAGTVEFLYDTEAKKFYFIEDNPSIQVEHTVTEEVTGIDLVRAQILVSQGEKLGDETLGLPLQKDVQVVGAAIQCRVTTEDPSNQFRPDYGRITHYRSAGGMGIRLDAGSAYSGAVVNPFYDSLLVKVTTRGRNLNEAAGRMERCLQEFRIRGVKTNIPFLISLITHPTFLAGDATTRMIDKTPELFELTRRRDRATRLLTFIAETVVNGNKMVTEKVGQVRREPAPIPTVDTKKPLPEGYRNRFLALGAKKFCDSIRDSKELLLTDTTMRDAHQSLLATRLRTIDMLHIAGAYARLAPEFFSLEMWGGATFDTSMRFLWESPWQRLSELRSRIPNILFQMLLRASNAVGYTNYPDNVVRAFVQEAAEAGVDIFRVFDALNWSDNMRVAMEAVVESGMICEAAICYTGDILNPNRPKYSLKYYVDLAKKLEGMGAHILAIKDMAGLCKPAAAKLLVATLKQEIGIPIHFHTHDTAGIQAASLLNAAGEGLEIADAGGDLYQHEMPGGQYTNLYQQAKALGLGDQWPDVCKRYADANQLLGDIVKVTPTSKAVGDLALFMVANQMSADDVMTGKRELAYPGSVLDLVGGMMGQPPGGFPEKVKKNILKNNPEVLERPGETLPPVDFDAIAQQLKPKLGRDATLRDSVTSALYPKVFDEFVSHVRSYGDVSLLPSPIFFFGPAIGEEFSIDIEPGKRLIVKFLAVGEPRPNGTRVVYFELNGQPREIEVLDKSIENKEAKRIKADAADPTHIAAGMPGMVIGVAVSVGTKVKKGQKLLALEAMKMETSIAADRDGEITQLYVHSGSQVEAGDLLLVLK